MNSSFQQPKWYKTRLGRIFLSILSVLFIIIVLFGILVGYYAWQVIQGNEVNINSPFSSTLSKKTLLDGAQVVTKSDMEKIIRPDNATLGNKTAPVTIVMFFDFECPYCQAAFLPLEEALSQYNEAVYLVFKHLPLISIHPRSVAAATSAQCANKQGKFWEYYRTLFTTKDLTENGLIEAAKLNNISITEWSTCKEDIKIEVMLNQELKDATTLGVRGTPTFFVNEERIEGVKTAEEWKSIILTALQK